MMLASALYVHLENIVKQMVLLSLQEIAMKVTIALQEAFQKHRNHVQQELICGIKALRP